MSDAEKELEKQVNELDGSGEDSSRTRAELDGERDQQSHARNQ